MENNKDYIKKIDVYNIINNTDNNTKTYKDYVTGIMTFADSLTLNNPNEETNEIIVNNSSKYLNRKNLQKLIYKYYNESLYDEKYGFLYRKLRKVINSSYFYNKVQPLLISLQDDDDVKELVKKEEEKIRILNLYYVEKSTFKSLINDYYNTLYRKETEYFFNSPKTNYIKLNNAFFEKVFAYVKSLEETDYTDEKNYNCIKNNNYIYKKNLCNIIYKIQEDCLVKYNNQINLRKFRDNIQGLADSY